MEEALTLVGTIDTELIPVAPDNDRAAISAFLKHGQASLPLVISLSEAIDSNSLFAMFYCDNDFTTEAQSLPLCATP